MAKPEEVANENSLPLNGAFVMIPVVEVLDCLTKRRVLTPKRAPPTKKRPRATDEVSPSSVRTLQDVDNVPQVVEKRREKIAASPDKSESPGNSSGSEAEGKQKTMSVRQLRKDTQATKTSQVEELDADLVAGTSLTKKLKKSVGGTKKSSDEEATAFEPVITRLRRGRSTKQSDVASTSQEDEEEESLNATLRDSIPLLVRYHYIIE
jgi:hypothetical protein